MTDKHSNQLEESQQDYEIIKRMTAREGALYDLKLVSVGSEVAYQDRSDRYIVYRGKKYKLQLHIKNLQDQIVAVVSRSDQQSQSFQLSLITVENGDFFQNITVTPGLAAKVGEILELEIQIHTNDKQVKHEMIKIMVQEQAQQYIGQPLSKIEQHVSLLKFSQFTANDVEPVTVYQRLKSDVESPLPKEAKLILVPSTTEFTLFGVGNAIETTEIQVSDTPIFLNHVGREERRLVAVFPDQSKLLLRDISYDILTPPSPLYYNSERDLEQEILKMIDCISDERIVFRRLLTSLEDCLKYSQANVEVMLSNALSLIVPVHIILKSI